MSWVSFNIFRTLGFPDTLQLKPEDVFKYREEISMAEWVLFPEYWQLNALIYGLQARVFPSEASYRLGHNKIEMTRAFELVAPANTPYTRILANTPENAEHLWNEMDQPFVAKLPKSSQGNGVWLIESLQDWRDYLSKSDVLYVQEQLPIDRDIRIVVIGDQVITAYWRLQAAQGFYNNVSKGGLIERSPVPEAAVALALHLARTLDINHAGFDIAMVGGHPYVLEFNRLFGNQGIEGGDAKLREVIQDYLQRQSTPTGPNFPSRPSSPRRRFNRAA
ncbi:ribosomal protein S6--L-glutamate ligase [Microbulbifer thermotolerans]|uniref:ATP-grasp domain-containing protein n=1 Tax=Microbulbifer thermotolerans TaxID=252514 RepID=UPI0008EECDD9|nr:alpha-L-glutamate ligase [Microbulbifer thermotolerans]SFD00926.1 ribosomal protein S6--L-glutamate ligase [Microbulbifer thermotolerans]